MKMLRGFGAGLLLLAIAAWTSHAGAEKAKKDDAPPLVVPISKPIQRTVTDYAEYTGRTSAKEVVTIQPRVTGFLVKVTFKEGAEVKEGDLLYEIDPRPYKAQLDAAKAHVVQNAAGLEYAKATNQRFKELFKKAPGAVSQRELDQYKAQEEQAKASLDLAKASLELAKLNLEWTSIRSPIAGYIGRSNLTVGNLVSQDVTKLTTVVAMDPMYVYFEMDELTVLRLRKAAKKGMAAPIAMRLAGEDGFPHAGTIDFVDSQVNPKNGNVMARAVFANAAPKDGVPLMLPGMFVRVRAPIGQPYEAILISDQVIVTDQGQKFAYVVGAENQVEGRRVTLGSLQEDGLRVITHGLKKDESVVVGKLQQVREGMKIQPNLVKMPALK